MEKIILRDFHNAICKVALIPDEYITAIDTIDDITHWRIELDDIETQSLYDSIDWDAIEYTWENHRDIPGLRMFDGYFWF